MPRKTLRYALFPALAFAAVFAAAQSAGVIEINSSNYGSEVDQSDLPVFLDYYATWCGPCKTAGPVLEDLAKEYAGKVKFGRIDIDREHAVVSKAFPSGHLSLPTFIGIKGGKELQRDEGCPLDPDEAKKMLRSLVEKLLKS